LAEDVKENSLLLRKGKILLPQDIGALAAAGVTNVSTYSPLKLTILSTGDELVAPKDIPDLGQIRDINTYALAALAEKTGFTVVRTMVLSDDETVLEHELRQAMKISDIVAVSGGSSQGEKDKTRAVIDKVSTPGVSTHGMAIKPGKPTIIGYDEASSTLFVGLPGHPVSAMMVFQVLLGWLTNELTGTPIKHTIPASLSCNVASSPGRMTCFPVKLEWQGDRYIAEPLFGKSGLITTLTEAVGYFTMNRNSEGLQAGTTVLIHLF